MKVNTTELSRQDAQLRTVIRQMLEVQESLLALTRSLGQESIGERFVPKVMDIAETVVGQTRDVITLRVALDLIAKDYAECESRVLDKAQGDALVMPRFPTGLVLPPRWKFPVWVEDWLGTGPGIVWIGWDP